MSKCALTNRDNNWSPRTWNKSRSLAGFMAKEWTPWRASSQWSTRPIQRHNQPSDAETNDPMACQRRNPKTWKENPPLSVLISRLAVPGFGRVGTDKKSQDRGKKSGLWSAQRDDGSKRGVEDDRIGAFTRHWLFSTFHRRLVLCFSFSLSVFFFARTSEVTDKKANSVFARRRRAKTPPNLHYVLGFHKHFYYLDL